jgi:hypothetical protein
MKTTDGVDPAKLIDPRWRATFSPAHPLADSFHPPYPPIASQSISRDVPLILARVLRLLTPLLKGVAEGCPLLRASNEHSFTVRVLRARRAPGRSLSILPAAEFIAASLSLTGAFQTCCVHVFSPNVSPKRTGPITSRSPTLDEL